MITQEHHSCLYYDLIENESVLRAGTIGKAIEAYQ